MHGPPSACRLQLTHVLLCIACSCVRAAPPPPASSPATASPLAVAIITHWSKYTTELYVATEVFAIICFALLMIFFLVLVLFQGAVSDHLRISELLAGPAPYTHAHTKQAVHAANQQQPARS